MASESGRIAFTITIDNQGKPVISDVTNQIANLEKTATGGTSKMSNGFAATWKSMALGAGAAIAVTGFMKDSVRAFMESEAIQADMIQTMTGLEIATDANIAKFTSLADEILRTTTIDDEAAKSMISLGLTMGVTSDRIEEAVKGAIGLGKAFGLDAQAAMKGVSAAMQGNYALLGRYIPALASAKTEQEKWALVQKAMTGGFQREQESLNTSLGMWKQFQNQIGEVKESVGGFLVNVIKWLYDARAAISAAALAMGTLFAIGKLNAWIASLKAGEGALMLIVQRAQLLHVMGEGGIISFMKSVNFASGEVTGLAGVLKNLPAVGAAAFIGWKIGERIGEITGLNKVTQDYFERLYEGSFLYKGQTAVLSEYTIAHAEAAKAVRVLRDTQRDAQTQAQSTIDTINKTIQGFKDKSLVVKENINVEKKHIEVIKTLNQIMEDRWAAAGKQFEQEKAYAAFVESKLGPAIVSWSDTIGFVIPKVEELTDAEKEFNEKIEKMSDLILDKSIPAIEKYNKTLSEIEKVEIGVANALGDLRGYLESLGYELTAAEEGVWNFGEGLINLGTSILSGDIGGIISGVAQAIGGLVQAIFGGGESYEEFAARMAEEASLAEALRLSLGNLADTINNAENMTAGGFEYYATALKDLIALSDLRETKGGVEVWAQHFGDAFTALIGKAKELGTEASASLINIFEDLENRGLRVAEVEAYIAEQLGAGLAGYEKMKAAMLESTAAQEAFGNVNIQVYEEMIAYNAKIAANKGITDAIAGATQALIGLSNTTKLTEGQYDQFEQSAASAYDKLIAQGFTSKESLQQLAPMLARLKYLHEEYGLVIDASTQALLDKAEAEGVNTTQAMSQAEANDRIVKSLEKLVEVLGGASKAAGDLSDSMDKAVRDRTANITFNKTGGGFEIPETGGVMGGQRMPEIYAASGFYSPRLSSDTLIQAHMGERVSITPSRSGGDSGQNIIVEDHSVLTIHVDPKSGIDQNDLAQTLKTIIADNRQTIVNTMAAAVARKL